MIHPDFHWLGLILAIAFGLGSGSYATMPAYRLPRGEPAAGKWLGPRSRCPSCKTKLRTRDLVPVFNWLLTRGKCQHCGVRISPNYFFIEFTITVLSALLYVRFGFGQEYLLLMILQVCLVILTSTDWLHKKMPDAVFIVMIMAGLMYRTLADKEIYGLVMSFMLSVYACYGFKLWYERNKRKLKRYEYLKLICVAAVWLNISEMLVMLALAGCIGALLWLYRRQSSMRVRYGLALMLAMLVTVLL